MARILVTWEFGAGLGHVTRLYPIVKLMLEQGHEVVIAAMNLLAAHKYFADLRVALLQAPAHTPPRYQITTPFTFTHILFNCGFAERDNLESRTRAWLDLFSLARPDLILADYSPGALMAARAQNRMVAPHGPGFECPPNESPLRNLRSRVNPDPKQLENIERSTLDNMNSVLATFGGRPLSHVAALYSEAAEQFLMTFQELDPYVDRTGTRYWGTTTVSAGKSPEWPDHSGPKLFVYMKAHAGLSAVLDEISRQRFSVIAYINPPPAELVPELPSRMRLESEPLNLEQTAREADMSVILGGHGATTTFLLAGKPLLIIPVVLEQALTGDRVAALGAGITATSDSPQDISDSLDQLSNCNRFHYAAQEFSTKYKDHTSHACAASVVAQCEQILQQG